MCLLGYLGYLGEQFPRKGTQPMGRGPEEGENVTFWGLKKKKSMSGM